MKNYKHSPERLGVLLIIFIVLIYNLTNTSDETAQILALCLLPAWGLAIHSWLKKSVDE